MSNKEIVVVVLDSIYKIHSAKFHDIHFKVMVFQIKNKEI